MVEMKRRVMEGEWKDSGGIVEGEWGRVEGEWKECGGRVGG